MREYVTIVSGMPRSGTSLAMQMLHAGGMLLLTDGKRPPDEHNPRGYWEYEPVKRLAKDSSWMENARGRTVKVVSWLLSYLPGGIEYRIVFLERDLEAVFASQQDLLLSRNEPAADEDRSLVLAALQADLAAVRKWLAQQAEMKVLAVPYDEVLREPLRWSSAMSEFLDGLDAVSMARAVEPGLRRHAILRGGR